MTRINADPSHHRKVLSSRPIHSKNCHPERGLKPSRRISPSSSIVAFCGDPSTSLPTGRSAQDDSCLQSSTTHVVRTPRAGRKRPAYAFQKHPRMLGKA